MSLLHNISAGFRGLLQRKQMDRDLDEEIRSHLELLTDEKIRSGMNYRDAAREAKVELGGIEQVKEQVRTVRAGVWLEMIWQDIRFGLRMLRKSPSFTVIAVLTLALGIGVNAAVFTVTNAALFKGFPLVQRNDRLLYMTTYPYCCVSYPDFEDWRAQAKSFTGMAIVHGVRRILSNQSGFLESYDATEVSSDTFKVVGQRPIMGRDFMPSDEIPGASSVAILSYGFWESRFAKDPAIIGRTIQMNGALTTIIGVMPQGFSFPQKQDLWVPLVPTPDVQKRENRDSSWFVFGRMADRVTIQTARAEMETIGRRLGSAYPLTNQGRNLIPQIQDFRGFFISPDETPIYRIMWGAVGFVLLIACANLANLLLARAITRSREISVRMAIGAGRRRVVRQLLIESVVLSSLGGFFGWWIAKWSVRVYAFADRGPGRSSWRILDYTMDYRVLGYLIAISLGAALLFGLAPALQLSKLDVNATLKDGGRAATAGESGRHLSDLLVIGEMALAVVLLAGAGVMIRSFLNIYNADLGVKTDDVLTMALSLPEAKYPSADTRISFYDRLTTRLETLPGVDSAAIAQLVPTTGSFTLPYELADAPSIDEQRRPTISALVIGPAYFQTLGAAVLSGREFNASDGVSGIPVVIVNQRFASQHWSGENPLGKRLRIFDEDTAGTVEKQNDWLTVVGVVPNIAQNGAARKELDPVVYLPYRERPVAGMEVMARTRVPPTSLAAAFRREMQAVDSDLPIFGPLTLAERLQGDYWSSGLYGVLFLIFAAIALLLASVGLYAVIAYSVSQRTQEIGVRMAVGATARDVSKLVFRQGMLPVVIGLTIGLATSFAVNRVLRAELVQVSPSDPVTLVVAAVVLILAATLGCLIPALRAIRVDPMVALRHE